MLDTIAALTALFTNDADLTASVSGTYSVTYQEVWDVGTNVQYPALAFSVTVDQAHVPEAMVGPESGMLRIWFLSQRETDCLRFRDAAIAKLNKREQQLGDAATLVCTRIRLDTSSVSKAPNTGAYQAYLSFLLIV